MIFITGDTHSEVMERFNEEYFPEQKEMTKDDYVIICGDFGCVWSDKDDERFKGMLLHEHKEQQKLLDWLDSLSFTTLFVDGNHENYDLLKKYPIEEWHGGKVQKIRPSVIHLMRGECYDINRLSFFTFGGASSHDMRDGIIDTDNPNWKQKAKAWHYAGKSFRIDHLSWWKEELPTQEEINHALETLDRIGWKCDYFISHCCAKSTAALLGCRDNDILTDFFEEIKYKLQYQMHYFGHYHMHRFLPDHEAVLYENIIRID